jgi:DNA polymerase V
MIKMGHGGARPGAGRKFNTGPFGENTVVKRIPISLVDGIEQFIDSWKREKNKGSFRIDVKSLKDMGCFHASNLNLPLFESRVSAGFPSPADDYSEASLDLNKHLISHPTATFFVRASGNSMINAGIHDNDILVVDRSLEPKHGNIVIAALNSELTVKRLYAKGGKVTLTPENVDYPAIEITEEMEFLIWGVVTSVVHQLNDLNK